jgi:hypothetical protein
MLLWSSSGESRAPVLAVDESFILHRCLVVERGHFVALIGRPRHSPPGQLLKLIAEIFVDDRSLGSGLNRRWQRRISK